MWVHGKAAIMFVCAYWTLVLVGLSAMLVEGLGWVAFGTYYLLMPLGALAAWRLAGLSFSDLGFRPYPGVLPHIAMGVTGSILSVGAIHALLRALGWVETTPNDWSAAGLLFGVAAQQAIVAGIEELSFRGVIQGLLTRRYGTQRGLIAAAALFGLFHLPNILYQDVTGLHIPLTVVVLTLMGVILGLAYLRTGQHLALPVALHFGWNVACFGLEAVRDLTFTGPRWLTGVTEWFPESGLLGALGLVALGLLVRALTMHPGRLVSRHPG